MSIFGNNYDVFISYKSKNVDIARLITDQLIASGKKVWFAEYQILLIDRDRFQEAINKGIRECKYGIALTNNDYADSEFCEKEMVQLLQFCGAENIIEIMIPDESKTHQKYEQLKKNPAHIFAGDVDETLNFVAQNTGWKIAPFIQAARNLGEDIFEGNCLGETYTIDVTGWELIDKSFHGGGPCYVRNVEGLDVFWNLQYGEDYSPRAYEARLRLSQKNDRALYEELCHYANRYFGEYKPGSRITAVHLLFIEGSSNFAITYHDGNFWKRRYSIMFLHPETYRVAEFVFTFQFPGSFKQYCRCVALMDDLVLTLNWGKKKKEAKERITKPPPMRSSQKESRISRIIEDQPMAYKFYNEGLSLAKQGHLEEAIAAWKTVLNYTTLIEMRGAVLFNMGRAYEKLDDEKQAIKCYKQSAETNPQQFNALCNLGTIYRRKSQPKEALNYFLEAANRNPNDSITINNIILCYEELGNYVEAESWSIKLSRLKPS